jgi:hypothetical protein
MFDSQALATQRAGARAACVGGCSLSGVISRSRSGGGGVRDGAGAAETPFVWVQIGKKGFATTYCMSCYRARLLSHCSSETTYPTLPLSRTANV